MGDFGMNRCYRNSLFALFAGLLLPLFIASLFSCSMLEADSPSSSVSFTFSGEFVQNVRGGVSSRAAFSEADTENLYVEISLLGSYTATKTAPLSEGTTVTFSEIPVGSKIRAKGQIYSVLEESEKEILYTGESEEITIAEGENRLALKMKKAESESTTAEYTVTFNTNDGTEAETQTVAKGEVASKPSDPNREGFAFLGWYSDSDFVEVFDFSTPITKDTTLYAKWIEGTGVSVLPTSAGKYYLTQDIEISSTWTVPSGETVLDLNGYGILMTERYSVISIGSEASLTINDSGNTVHYVTLSEYRATAVSDSGEETAPSNGTGVVKISGGYIAGGATNQGGGINLRGSLIINGGTLIGNNGTEHGGAIFARGNLTITGGKIIYNTASYQGAGIDFGDKALVITGGTISNNYSKGNSVSHAGGVHLCAGNGTCTISGNPVIKDNSNSQGTLNVGMDANTYITIGATGLGESASIGVSMATAGVFTNSTNTSYNDESKFGSDDESYIVSQNSGGQIELTSKPVTLATALKAGAEIVCAYSETKWGGDKPSVMFIQI